MTRSNRTSTVRRLPVKRVITAAALLAFFLGWVGPALLAQSSSTTAASPASSTAAVTLPLTGRAPSESELSRHFGDAAGNLPIAAEIDAAPGELCDNGRSFYSVAAGKGLTPAGWAKPPRIGTDPNYLGPDPKEPLRESPYGMPAPPIVLVRPPITATADPEFERAFKRFCQEECRGNTLAVLGSAELPGFLSQTRRLAAKKLDSGLLKKKSEELLVKELRSRNADLLLFDRSSVPVAPWLEDSYQVLGVRLRDLLEFEQLEPKIIGRRWVLYRLRPQPTLTDQQLITLTTLARRVLAGELKPQENLPLFTPQLSPSDQRGNQSGYRVAISLRFPIHSNLGGRKVARRIGRASTVVGAVEQASRRLAAEWLKTREKILSRRSLALPLDIREALPSLELEFDLFYDQAEIADRALAALPLLIQPGVHGLFLQTKDNFFYLEPAFPLYQGLESPRALLTYLLRQLPEKPHIAQLEQRNSVGAKFEIIESSWLADKELRFGRFRSLAWRERSPEGELVRLYRGNSPVSVDMVNEATLTKALTEAATWLTRNQQLDGRFGYQYSPFRPVNTRWSSGGNIVRHGLNPYSLLLINAVAPDKQLVSSAKRGIDHTLSFLRRSGRRCLICHRDPPAPFYNAKTGTVVVTLLSLLELKKVEQLSPEHQSALECLAEELLYVQDPNGNFRQYDVAPEHPYYGALSTIPPGQIILTLARLYQTTEDQRFLTAAKSALAFFRTQWQHLEKNRVAGGIYDEQHRVALISAVPWLLMALRELYIIDGQAEYLEFADQLYSWSEDLFSYFGERVSFPDYLGAGFKTHTEPAAINFCQTTEGSSAYYSLLTLAKRERRKIGQRVLEGARFCLQLQLNEENSFYLPDPATSFGGFRYHLGVARQRNDYSYHAIAALAGTLSYGQEDGLFGQEP